MRVPTKRATKRKRKPVPTLRWRSPNKANYAYVDAKGNLCIHIASYYNMPTDPMHFWLSKQR